MLVRLALESDEDTFVYLSKMAVEESAPHVGFSDAKVRETFKKYLVTANPTIFLADHMNDVVGFLLATMSGYRFADGLFTTQEVLFVRPDKRGTRAAALLVGDFVAWSDRLGAIENTGGNDNRLFTETTAKLLKRYGFEQVGVFMRRIGSAESGEKGR